MLADFSLKAIRGSFPKSVCLPALALSLAIHVLVILAVVGMDVSFSSAGIVLGVTFLALSLPITIAGFGYGMGCSYGSWCFRVQGHRGGNRPVQLPVWHPTACKIGGYDRAYVNQWKGFRTPLWRTRRTETAQRF